MTGETSNRPNVQPSKLKWGARVAILALLALALQPAIAVERGWTVVEEYWYTITLAGGSAGWMHSTVEEDGEQYRSSVRLTMRFGRGEQVVEITSNESFLETRAGNPIRMSLRQIQGTAPVSHEWDFTGEKITHTVTQFGRTRTSEHEHPEGMWLTRRAADRYVRERRAAGANEITYRTLTPETGVTPTTVTTRRAGESTFRKNDRQLPVTVWATTMDAMPIAITEYISSDGYLVRQSLQVGSERLVMTLATRKQALEAATRKPPELLIGLMVTPNRPIRNVFDTRRVTMKLRVREGEAPTLPAAGSQRVKNTDDAQSVMVIVDPRDPLPATDQDRERVAYRHSSSMIDFDDEKVRRLVEATTPEDSLDHYVLARRLQQFVHRYIDNKGLDTAFASASETARTRTGDCTEHAVLLAALLRGHGIPARVAAGLIYTDEFAGERGVFGWHMWTQALIDGHWIDLDAVLPNKMHHAAYVLTGTSGLADDARLEDMTTWLHLIGNLEIDIVEVAYE